MKTFLKVATVATLCVSLTGCGMADSFVQGFTEAAKEDLSVAQSTQAEAAPETPITSSSSTSTSAPKTTTPKSSPQSTPSTSTKKSEEVEVTKSAGKGTYPVKVDGETFVRDGFDVICAKSGDEYGVGVNSKGIEYSDRPGSFFGAVLKNGELEMLAMQKGTMRGSNELSPDSVQMTKSGNTYTFTGEADFQDSRQKEAPVKKKIEATVTCP